MAHPLFVNRLGHQKLTQKRVTDLNSFLVKVRRQDSTIDDVRLMEELIRFLENEMPGATSQFLAYPKTFEYNQDALKTTQGFPEGEPRKCPAQKRPRNQDQIHMEHWQKKAVADLSEAKTFRALETIFQIRPSLLLTGVKTEKILQVARESAKYSLGQSKNKDPHIFSCALTTEERSLWQKYSE